MDDQAYISKDVLIEASRKIFKEIWKAEKDMEEALEKNDIDWYIRWSEYSLGLVEAVKILERETGIPLRVILATTKDPELPLLERKKRDDWNGESRTN